MPGQKQPVSERFRGALVPVLATALVAALSSWGTMAIFAGDKVSVDQLEVLGPYPRDKGRIEDAQTRTSRDIEKIQQALETTAKVQAEALAELRALRAELEALIRYLESR